MEDKKYLNMDELKDLGLDDLESVAGGGGLRKVTPEEFQHYTELKNKFDSARAAYENGTGTQEELDAAREAMLSYVRASCGH